VTDRDLYEPGTDILQFPHELKTYDARVMLELDLLQ
jgi:hypothetical protein